jgi:hypothetical protein
VYWISYLLPCSFLYLPEDIKAECPKWGQNWKEEGHLIADLYLSWYAVVGLKSFMVCSGNLG